LAQDFGRLPLELHAQRTLAQAAGVAGVPVIHLLVQLVAGHRDLLRVHDDDEVAGVDVRREGRLALPAQALGDHRREPAQGLPLGVDDEPVALNLARFGGIRLHAEKRRTRRPPVANGSSPSRNAARPPWDGWRTGSASGSARAATRPTATTIRPRASSSVNGRPPATSPRVGGLFELAVPGCVGTTFQRRTSAVRPSSARTRCTMVAVASAGPVPEIWRSLVKGRPETRAPR